MEMFYELVEVVEFVEFKDFFVIMEEVSVFLFEYGLFGEGVVSFDVVGVVYLDGSV